MSASTNDYQRISADLVIPGTGNPIKNGVVIIKDNIIAYVGEIENAPTYNNYNIDIKVPVIMPGLWDCHVHFQGLTNIALSKHKGELFDLMGVTPDAIAVGRSIKQLSTAIEFGITSVREVGGYGLFLKQLVNEGSILGPNIHSAGRSLSITGGHLDLHNFPYSFMCLLCKQEHGPNIVDGDAECLKAVRKNIRNGADLIKIHATGGVLSVNDRLESRQFSDNEIKTIVDEAKRNGIIVAAHCHGRDGIEASIENGVYTIEHGSFLDEALAKKMKEKNCILVPTKWITEWLNDEMGKQNYFAEKSKEKFQKVIKSHRNAFKIALKHNVKIACGTDMGLDFWGQNMKELEHYVTAGMDELQAIETATSNGPLTLGPYRNIKSGQLKQGYDADIIALTKNPLKNIKILQNSKNIVMVWKNGKIVKNIYDKNQISSKL